MPARIERVEVATGRRQLWKELRPADPAGVFGITSVVVTPDGTSYAYTLLFVDRQPLSGRGHQVETSLRRSEQQRLDAMGVHHVLARRPGEDREVPVLRRNERDGVALVVDELRGRQMPRPAELDGVQNFATLPSIGSVTATRSTCGCPSRRPIFAPNARSS